MKSTWKLLNMVIGTKSKTTNINSFTIDGKEIRDPKEIKDKLNQYFCDSAKRVQEEAYTGNSETPNVDFQSYLTKLPKTDRTFRFKRITPNDIVQLIAKLKNSRSGNIRTRFFKDASKYLRYQYYLTSH